ncbi:unnamed protein product [Dicrocoelium dendriticum]|nr:unnamed protein product [Dicrocoelium dendriticum]
MQRPTSLPKKFGKFLKQMSRTNRRVLCISAIVLSGILLLLFTGGDRSICSCDGSYAAFTGIPNLLVAYQDFQKGSTKHLRYPADFPVIMQDVNLCRSSDQPDLIVLIKTTHDQYRLRQQVRQTWGNSSCYSKHGLSARVLFLFGVLADQMELRDHLQTQLNWEHRTYQDILQFGFVDTYRNNTHKVKSALKYLTERCPQSRYIVIFDEDFLVHPRNLVSTLNSVTEIQYPIFFAGLVRRAEGPSRYVRSKWYVSRSEYPYNAYPPFVCGGAVLMSMPFANMLSFGLQSITYLFMDDVLMAIVAHEFNILPVNVAGIHSPCGLKRLNRKLASNLVAAHEFRNVTHQAIGWTILSQPC